MSKLRPLVNYSRDDHRQAMRKGAVHQRTFSFTVVFFILLIVLFPLMTGMRNALGIHGLWSRGVARWHDELDFAVSGKKPERDQKGSQPPAEALLEVLGSREFRALMRFSPALASSGEELASLIRRENQPGSLEELLEIEMRIDQVSLELEELSDLQVTSFETLLFVSLILTALLLFFFGYQGRQLLTAREKRARADEMKQRSAAIYESERKRLARDLHDGLSQNIALARMAVDRLPGGNEKQQLQLSLDQGFQELRSILYNLRSTEADLATLDEMVRRECSIFQEGHGLVAALTLDLDLEQGIHPPWGEEQLSHFIRILQEGLVNVIRHSGAGAVKVSLHRRGGNVELLIADDGRGMDASSPGFGITGMKERALLLGGTITWESGAGKGTEINLTVPEVLS